MRQSRLGYRRLASIEQIVLLVVILLSAGCAKDRQEVVAEKGAQVMPFDLEKSTHIFDKIENGGRQQVLSDDGDREQVALIREHLSEESARFSEGNFASPSAIHGEGMPGLQALAAHSERIDINYSDIEMGGQILYSTEDSSLVGEIHKWFDAQLSDHGSHAEGMDMEMHKMHHGN